MVEIILLQSRLEWGSVGDINRVSSLFWDFLKSFLVIHEIFLDFLATVTHWHYLISIKRNSRSISLAFTWEDLGSQPLTGLRTLFEIPDHVLGSIQCICLQCPSLRALCTPPVVLPGNTPSSQVFIKTGNEYMISTNHCSEFSVQKKCLHEHMQSLCGIIFIIDLLVFFLNVKFSIFFYTVITVALAHPPAHMFYWIVRILAKPLKLLSKAPQLRF